MKTSTRRWVGAGLIASACVTPLVLAGSNFGQGRLLESHTVSAGSWTATSSVYELHWPLWLTLLLLSVAGVGLLLVLLPRREKPVN